MASILSFIGILLILGGAYLRGFNYISTEVTTFIVLLGVGLFAYDYHVFSRGKR